MKDELRRLLNAQLPELIKTLDIEHGLLSELLSKGVLEDDHVESIESKSTQREKIETFCSILKRRDDDAFEVFVRTLSSKQHGVAQLLVNPLADRKIKKTLKRQDGCNGGLSVLEELRLERIASKSQEENSTLVLENEILKLRTLNKCLEKELIGTKDQLSSTRDANDALEISLREKSCELGCLKEKYSDLREDMDRAKEQGSLLTRNLKESQDELRKVAANVESKDLKISDLEKFIDVLTKEKRQIETKLCEIEEKYPKFVADIRQRGKNIQVRGGTVIMGVSLFNNRIYVVCLKSKRLHVFKDEQPFDQLFSEQFEINGLNNPRDLASCEKSRCLFISDEGAADKHKIWHLENTNEGLKMQRVSSLISDSEREKIPIKQTSLEVLPTECIFKVSSWPINRKPGKMHVCSNESQSKALLVVLAASFDRSGEEYFAYVYRISEKKLLWKVFFPSELGEVHHVVVHFPQTRGSNNPPISYPDHEEAFNGNFVVSHKSTTTTQDGQTKSVWLVSKLSSSGTAIVNSFLPSVVDGINICRPDYLWLVDGAKVLVVDGENNRLLILGSKLTGGQVLVKNDNGHSLEKPTRVAYHRLKRMLVVGHWGPKGSFSVFTH